MPYIKNERRRFYLNPLDRLISALKTTMTTAEEELVGDLTFVFYKIAKELGTYGDVRFKHHAAIEKALSKAEDEYKRRISEPYEDNKIKENGDV